MKNKIIITRRGFQVTIYEHTAKTFGIKEWDDIVDEDLFLRVLNASCLLDLLMQDEP